MKRNKTSTMPDTDFWREYARKHPESAQREWELLCKTGIVWTDTHRDYTPTSEEIERVLTEVFSI